MTRAPEQIRADDVRPGDTILGLVGRDSYPNPLTVGKITDHNRDGRRIGPRFYSTTPKTIGTLNARADAVFHVMRADAP